MLWKYTLSSVGTIGFVVAAVLAAVCLLRRSSRAGQASVIAVLLIVLMNAIGGTVEITRAGVVDSLRQSFASGMLLATLIALVGVVGRSAAGMQGLDAVLFLIAAAVQFGSLFQIGQPGVNVAYKSWFVSHQVAFVVSVACFVAAGGAGAVYLIITELLRRKHGLTLLGRLAPLESLERFGRWMLVIGFPALTYGVLTGFCQLSRQRNPGPLVWLREPIVIFTLVLWVVYALGVLALWFRPRMRGRRGATFATAGLVLIVVGFVVTEHASKLHR